MADRIETKPFTNKIDSRLQTLIASPYAQSQLQFAGLISHRGQMISYNDYARSLSRRKRQRREREAITQEIVLRALKIDHNHRRSRHHQFEVAARRIVNNNIDILSRQYRKKSNGRKKSRENSAPGCLTKGENDDSERRLRVTSVSNRQSKLNKDLSESDDGESRIERLIKSNVLSLERHACEMTMSYRSKTTVKTENPVRDEIVVMQQHSTGENLVVYRGFIAKDETFSFKSQRRPTSALSLAFYAKGFIDSVVNDCCEFKYGRRKQHINESSQFRVERVRKASPCEKCRKIYSQRAPTPDVDNTSSDMTQSQHFQNVRHRHLTPISKLPVDNQEGISLEKQSSSSKEHHEKRKVNKKYPIVVKAFNEHDNKQVTKEQKSKKASSSKKQMMKERLGSIDFSLLESSLVLQVEPSTQVISIESSNVSSINEKQTATIIQQKTSPTLSQYDHDSQQWATQTDTLPWESSSENTTTIDSGNAFQLFMTQLQQQLQKYQARLSNVVRHEKSVENFIYILDGNLPISTRKKRKLRSLINFGRTFNDINDETCIEFIEQIVNEQIIMILSRTSMKNLDTNIRNASQLRFIYIVDDTKDSSNDFEKNRGIYTNISSVCVELEKDIKLLTYDLTRILSVAADDTSDSTFAYIQVLKDILLETDEKTDLKKEMLDFCRQEYAENEVQLRFIDEFEQNFQADEAVKWYIRQETFLFKMLTRALRIPDPDILFKLRFFIQHLHHQLKSNLSKTSMTVYRAQHISNDDFDTILKNQGGFLAFNQFLSTNKTKIIPKKAKNDLLFNNSEVKFVLFQMEIGTTIPRTAIETIPEEILITMATVFRISHVEQIDKEIPIIKLTSSDEALKAAQEVTKSVREAARGPFPLLRMAKLMKQMEYIQYTEHFCLILMNDPIAVNNEIANLTVGGLFHTLCSFYYEQEQYDRALEQLEKSLQVYLRVLPPDDIKLTPTYNNMGSIYHKQGLDEQALQFHKKAYDTQVKSSNPDPDSVASYASNIASVLIKQGKYEESIPYLQRDLQIRQRLHPNEDDTNLAVKYHNLAGAQFRVHKYSDALENYRKCLEIELRVHSANHPTVAVSYYNMATTLEGLGQLEEAIETIKKARERLLLTRDENDEEVQMHQEYEKRLQQKLWVKNHFHFLQLTNTFKTTVEKMYSVRLARRQPFVDEKCPPLEQTKLVNRLGQITSMPSIHLQSRQRDRLYARNVVSQSVVEWFRKPQKPVKQKRRDRKQSLSPINKHHNFTNRQTHSDLASFISSTQKSATSTRTTRIKADNHHKLHPSSFPSRITTDHVTFQKDSLHKDDRSLFNISQTFSMSSIIEDKQYPCQITMVYRLDTNLFVSSHNFKRDEVTVLQEANNGSNSVVFKGFLKAGDTFTFKSQRLINDRFRLIICINDLVDSYVSSCCEFKYQDGVRIGEEDGLFWIENIDGAQPCRKCRENVDLLFKSHSIDERLSTSVSSRTSSRLKLPMIHTNQSTSEPKSKSTSITKSITARDIDTDEFQAASTTSQSTVSLPINHRSSSSSSNLQWSARKSTKSSSKQSSSESTISKKSEIAAVSTKVSSSSSSVASEKKIEKGHKLTASLSQVQTTNNEITFPQSQRTLIQPIISQSEPSTSISPRQTGDVENFSVAWIGESEENDFVLLRHALNFIRVFADLDTLNTFLTESIHNKVIILLSYDNAQSIIHQIHKITCIYSIYLLSTDKHEQSNWTKDYYKITGVYRTIESIRDHLLKTLPQISSALIPVTTTADGSTDDIPFTYCQLLKETMLCNDDESDLKKDMLEFCRLHYANNPDEMNNIDQFEKEFTFQKVIWWYTRNSFIAKILNRAFRTQEIDLLYKMRYFIQCLQTELKSIAMKETTIVYVALEIPLANAKNLQKNIHGLLLFGAFLPAMLQQPQAFNFNEDSEQISIIFAIHLGSGCGARVKHLCSPDLNMEVLINIDTIFRIRSVEKENDKQWNIHLESVGYMDQKFKQLTDPLRSEIEAPVVLLQISKLLLATNHYGECDYLAELLFTDQSLRGDPTLLASLAAVHHLLGNKDDERGDAKSARQQFFKSLRAFQSFLPSDHPLMSSSYNNIGSMYFKDNEYNEAITFHQKALECQLKSANPDTDSMSTYSNNIGAVYFEQGKYSEALKHLHRAVAVLEKLSAADKNMNLCIIYQKIAACYWRIDKAKEALEYYKKTLDIQLVSLPPTAHQISVTYFNLSTAYARVGQIDDAVMSAEKSVEQLLKIFPPDHDEVKENQAQLEIVRQKQWLQQVLSN